MVKVNNLKLKNNIILLFSVLAIMGISFFVWNPVVNKTIRLNDYQCSGLSDSIVNVSKNGAEADKLLALNTVYKDNCLGRPLSIEKIKKNKELPSENCEAIEVLLLDETTDSVSIYNVYVYYKLAKYGCKENIEKYKKLFLRQIELSFAYSDGQEIRNELNNLKPMYEKLGLFKEYQMLEMQIQQ